MALWIFLGFLNRHPTFYRAGMEKTLLYLLLIILMFQELRGTSEAQNYTTIQEALTSMAQSLHGIEANLFAICKWRGDPDYCKYH